MEELFNVAWLDNRWMRQKNPDAKKLKRFQLNTESFKTQIDIWTKNILLRNSLELFRAYVPPLDFPSFSPRNKYEIMPYKTAKKVPMQRF